ncbi:MAG: hypothetical protein E6730_05180, partial [Enterococcus casseliflavus]|nr:hypothetical protein [Enterococcus casseliflavus]
TVNPNDCKGQDLLSGQLVQTKLAVFQFEWLLSEGIPYEIWFDNISVSTLMLIHVEWLATVSIII